MSAYRISAGLLKKTNFDWLPSPQKTRLPVKRKRKRPGDMGKGIIALRNRCFYITWQPLALPMATKSWIIRFQGRSGVQGGSCILRRDSRENCMSSSYPPSHSLYSCSRVRIVSLTSSSHIANPHAHTIVRAQTVSEPVSRPSCEEEPTNTPNLPLVIAHFLCTTSQLEMSLSVTV